MAAAPAGPIKVSILKLRYEPGPAVWTGTATHEGRELKLLFKGKGLPGATPKEVEKREVKAGVECLVTNAGGGVFAIRELVR